MAVRGASRGVLPRGPLRPRLPGVPGGQGRQGEALLGKRKVQGRGHQEGEREVRMRLGVRRGTLPELRRG